MAKDPTANFKKKMKALRDKMLSKSTLNSIGKETADMIRERTKKGYGLKDADSKTQKKLEALSPSYIKHRKRYPPFGDDSTPTKSNLTYTGDMLEAIDHKVSGKSTASRKLKVSIFDEEQKEKADWAAEGSDNRPERHFLGLTKGQEKILKKFIENLMKKTGK